MREEPKSKRAVGYARVSTDEQAKGLSLDNQTDRIKSYCQSQGWELEEVYTDPGYSGKDLNRPGLSRMIEKIKAGGTDVVLVYKVDRLTRKQKDLWTIIENIFEPHKVGFKSITEPFETTTPMGRAFLGMLSVFAQLERDQTRERIKDGLAFKKVKREWVGHPPYGYRMLSKSDGKGGIIKDKQLTIDMDQAAIVKWIFNAFSKGHGLTHIVRILQDKGINGRKWSAAGIKEILLNGVYLGNGSHQAIISKRLFNQAQGEFRKRSSVQTPIDPETLRKIEKKVENMEREKRYNKKSEDN